MLDRKPSKITIPIQRRTIVRVLDGLSSAYLYKRGLATNNLIKIVFSEINETSCLDTGQKASKHGRYKAKPHFEKRVSVLDLSLSPSSTYLPGGLRSSVPHRRYVFRIEGWFRTRLWSLRWYQRGASSRAFPSDLQRMVAFFPELSEDHIQWIKKQSMFFVGTSPLHFGKVNVSPKGLADASLTVAGPNTIFYQDATGSGKLSSKSVFLANSRF
jgi:hypothetical protein